MTAILCNTIVSGEETDGSGGVSRRSFTRNQLLFQRGISLVAASAWGQHKLAVINIFRNAASFKAQQLVEICGLQVENPDIFLTHFNLKHVRN